MNSKLDIKYVSLPEYDNKEFIDSVEYSLNNSFSRRVNKYKFFKSDLAILDGASKHFLDIATTLKDEPFNKNYSEKQGIIPIIYFNTELPLVNSLFFGKYPIDIPSDYQKILSLINNDEAKIINKKLHLLNGIYNIYKVKERLFIKYQSASKIFSHRSNIFAHPLKENTEYVIELLPIPWYVDNINNRLICQYELIYAKNDDLLDNFLNTLFIHDIINKDNVNKEELIDINDLNYEHVLVRKK